MTIQTDLLRRVKQVILAPRDALLPADLFSERARPDMGTRNTLLAEIDRAVTSPEQVVYLFPRSGVKAGAPGFLEARFYWNPHKSSYFQGLGRSDAEAIGSLICRCPERFGVRWDITTEEEIEALHQQRRARTCSLPSSENTTAEM